MQSICEMRNFCAPICRARTSAMQSWREQSLALADLHDADFSRETDWNEFDWRAFQGGIFLDAKFRMPICAVLFLTGAVVRDATFDGANLKVPTCAARSD